MLSASRTPSSVTHSETTSFLILAPCNTEREGILASHDPFMHSPRCLSTSGQAFSCWSLDHYSMLKRKKLLVSCFSPGLFGFPEKLQATGNYTVKAGLLHGHTTAAILGARAK